MIQPIDNYFKSVSRAREWFMFASDAKHKLGATMEYENEFVTKVCLNENVVVWDGSQAKMNGVPLEGGFADWLKAIQA